MSESIQGQAQQEMMFQNQLKEANQLVDGVNTFSPGKWAPQSLFAAMKGTWFIESFESGMVRVIVMEPPKTHKYAYLTVPEVKSLIQSLQLACDAIDFKNKSEMPYTPQIPPEAQPTGLVQTPGVMQLVD